MYNTNNNNTNNYYYLSLSLYIYICRERDMYIFSRKRSPDAGGSSLPGSSAGGRLRRSTAVATCAPSISLCLPFYNIPLSLFSPFSLFSPSPFSLPFQTSLHLARSLRTRSTGPRVCARSLPSGRASLRRARPRCPSQRRGRRSGRSPPACGRFPTYDSGKFNRESG